MIERLLKHFRMENCKPAITPLPAGLEQLHHPKNVLNDQTPHRELISALLHLSNTLRPDIFFAVKYLSRFMHNSTTALWNSAQPVLRYLRGTSSLGLWFHSGIGVCIRAFSDSDWANKNRLKNLFVRIYFYVHMGR